MLIRPEDTFNFSINVSHSDVKCVLCNVNTAMDVRKKWAESPYSALIHYYVLSLSDSMGLFFIGNRLLLTGYLFSDRLNVEKE